MTRWNLIHSGFAYLAALECFGGVGRGDGGAELALGAAQESDHLTVGVEALAHHLVCCHRLVQHTAEVSSLWRAAQYTEEVSHTHTHICTNKGFICILALRAFYICICLCNNIFYYTSNRCESVRACVCVYTSCVGLCSYLFWGACTGPQRVFCSSVGWIWPSVRCLWPPRHSASSGTINSTDRHM